MLRPTTSSGNSPIWRISGTPGDGLALGEALGLKLGEIDSLGLTLGLTLGLSDGEVVGAADALGLLLEDCEGLTDGDFDGLEL
jgi:hypothetical protein